MEKKAASGIMLVLLLFIGTLALAFNTSFVKAEFVTPTFVASESVAPEWFAVGNGAVFQVTNSSYLNVTLMSSECVRVCLESVPRVVSFGIESLSSATSTMLTLSGLMPSVTYYRYQDGNLTESFTADLTGSYSYVQDITVRHHIFIVERISTIYIRPDGSVDPATAPIQRVGNVYTFTANIYETIVVQRSAITIDGNGYTLQGANASASYGFYLYNLPFGVTITKTNIQRFTYAIWVLGPMGAQPSIFITGNTITNNGDSIRLNGGFPFFASITGNTITNNSGGISLFTPGGIPEMSPPAYIKDNTIANNGGGVSVSGFAPPYIIGNTIRNNGGGVSVSDTNPVYGASISGNNITNNAGGVSMSGGYPPSDVSGNTITNNGGGVTVSGYVTDIYGNTITNNSGGVCLNAFIAMSHWGSIAYITGNTIANNTGGVCLNAFRRSQSYSMFPPHISGNTIANNGRGLSVSGFSFVLAYQGASITGNTITDNENYSLYLNSSNYNSVSRNTITNSPRGLQLSSSNNNTVSENTITNNGYGVYLYESSDNKFYHNNLINNTMQADVTVNYQNTWDNGYPSGGNYWSDYTGTDLYSGPDQNIPGSDFRGDTPYAINLKNTDHYPLMIPYETKLPPVIILSPENKIYSVNILSLTFTVDETTIWMGYSLDSQPTVTITGNTTLTGLADGRHHVVVYANDIFGNMGSSSVYFTVDTTLPTVTILSPENKTYSMNTVSLTFTVSESTSWMGYSLDGQANVTIAGSATLTGLSDGMHNLSVYACDIVGNTGSDTVYFTVDTIPPVADAGPDQTVDEDTVVTFDGSASTDNFGIVSYEWDFGDETSGTGKTTTHEYTNAGIYTVTLTVEDAAGNQATDTVIITVLKLTPEQLIQRLVETIQTWKLHGGTENSLTSKLEEALHLLNVGNENGATHNLMEFISQVEALEGKKLTNDQANYLIDQAQKIIDRIKE